MLENCVLSIQVCVFLTPTSLLLLVLFGHLMHHLCLLSLVSSLFVDLINRLGVVIFSARHPVIVPQINNVLHHESHTRRGYPCLNYFADLIKVLINPWLEMKKKSLEINPLSPNIIIQILLTNLHRYYWLLVGRTFSNIKTIHLQWSIPSFSWLVCVIMHWYDEKKFDADHYWGLKVSYACAQRNIFQKKKHGNLIHLKRPRILPTNGISVVWNALLF